MIFTPSEMAHQDAYKLAVGAVVPRPIAFVSTRSRAGVDNLAPFSFFTVVCANPLTIAFSPMRKGPQALKKDTLVNIEETGEFVVNVVDESYVGPMNTTSADYEPEESEFVFAGLTPEPSEVVAPPRVGESPIQMECKLLQVVEVSDRPGGGSLVIGTVVRMHVRDDLYENGRILLERWRPLGRMAGATFARCTDTFDLARPTTPERPAKV
ncbi:MAG TPA: flavin reductase family protein [Oscillatoriaceae cyanobacterium]